MAIDLLVNDRRMGFNSFAWNCEGMFITQKAVANDGAIVAQNYSIGHIGLNGVSFVHSLILVDFQAHQQLT